MRIDSVLKSFEYIPAAGNRVADIFLKFSVDVNAPTLIIIQGRLQSLEKRAVLPDMACKAFKLLLVCGDGRCERIQLAACGEAKAHQLYDRRREAYSFRHG